MSSVTQLADPRSVARARVGRKLNKAEAQALTEQIRQTAGSLWQLVAEAHDRKAWQALGYASWKDYAVDELQMSESRSYQLVDTGRVMRAIAQASDGQLPRVVTARETARIKPHLTTFTKAVQKAVKGGLPVEEAVNEALEALPTKERPAPAEPRSKVDAVIEGEIIEQKSRGGIRPGETIEQAYAREQRERARQQGDDDGPGFSGETTVVIPRGRAICDHCNGAGYV